MPPKKRKAQTKLSQTTTSGQPKAKAAKHGDSSSFKIKELVTESSWAAKLQPLFDKAYVQKIEELLSQDYKAKKEIFPPKELIFNAFNLVPFSDVRLVILGQDPYHDNGQAHGLSFSVPEGIGIPPSLKNIYKELETDIPGFKQPSHGCLEKWAQQGVLLLNATLTVEAHNANSHAKYGWQDFTNDVIKLISDQCDAVVFILWGGFAHKKEKLIDGRKHTVIKTAHPSPLSFNKFKGCKCFSKTNDALQKLGRQPINWSI